MFFSEHNKLNIFRKLSFMFCFSYLSPIKLESPLPAYVQTLHQWATSCPDQQTQKYHSSRSGGHCTLAVSLLASEGKCWTSLTEQKKRSKTRAKSWFLVSHLFRTTEILNRKIKIILLALPEK